MFNLYKFISDHVTGRSVSMFEEDIQANKETLTREIKDKKVCVIEGRGLLVPVSSKQFSILSRHLLLLLISTRMDSQNSFVMFVLLKDYLFQTSSVVTL